MATPTQQLFLATVPLTMEMKRTSPPFLTQLVEEKWRISFHSKTD